MTDFAVHRAEVRPGVETAYVREGGFPSDAESYHAPQSTGDRKTIFIDS